MIAIFSDLHLPLEDDQPPNKRFFSILRELANDQVREVWLLGDIYDLFVSDQKFWLETHQDFFECLKKLHEKKISVHWFEGNHDFHLEKLLRPIGVEYHTEDKTRQINNLKVYIGHGDTINSSDLDYLRWRSIIKNQLFRKILSSIPSSLARRIFLPIAQKASHQSRHRGNKRDLEKATALYKDFASNIIKEQHFDAVIVGHHHFFSLQTYESGKFYLNLGTWGTQLGRYALWEPGKLPQIIDVRI